jgi:hypothetical protein
MRIRTLCSPLGATLWFFILAIALSGPGSAAAQGQLGFQVGLNSSKLGGDAAEFGNGFELMFEEILQGNWESSQSRYTGMAIGGYYFLDLSPTVGIQIEATYIRRGVKFAMTGFSAPYKADIYFRLGYAEIPVLVRYMPSPASRTRLMVVAGPLIGFKLGTDLVLAIDGEKQSVDVADIVEGTSYGLLGGIGVVTSLTPQSTFVFQARYFHGLADVFDPGGPGFSTTFGDLGFFAGVEVPFR